MSKRAVKLFFTSIKALINNNKKTGGNGDSLKNHNVLKTFSLPSGLNLFLNFVIFNFLLLEKNKP